MGSTNCNTFFAVIRENLSIFAEIKKKMLQNIAQLDHTSKQCTRGQLSAFNIVSMRCQTEQPRTHALTDNRQFLRLASSFARQ